MNITLPRATVEQALEALTAHADLLGTMYLRMDAITALRAALAQQAEPVEPVGTFLVTGNEFCGAPPAPYATWGDALASMFAAGTVQGLRISALAQQGDPVEPVAWAFRHSDGTYHDPSVTEHSAGMVPLYTAPPQRKPLTIERLRDALVASRIIPPAAVEDSDGYDDGLTLFRIEALHRRIT